MPQDIGGFIMKVLLLLIISLSLLGCSFLPIRTDMVESATKAGCVMAKWSRQVSKEYILCFKPVKEETLYNE